MIGPAGPFLHFHDHFRRPARYLIVGIKIYPIIDIHSIMIEINRHLDKKPKSLFAYDLMTW